MLQFARFAAAFLIYITHIYIHPYKFRMQIGLWILYSNFSRYFHFVCNIYMWAVCWLENSILQSLLIFSTLQPVLFFWLLTLSQYSPLTVYFCWYFCTFGLNGAFVSTPFLSAVIHHRKFFFCGTPLNGICGVI